MSCPLEKLGSHYSILKRGVNTPSFKLPIERPGTSDVPQDLFHLTIALGDIVIVKPMEEEDGCHSWYPIDSLIGQQDENSRAHPN